MPFFWPPMFRPPPQRKCKSLLGFGVMLYFGLSSPHVGARSFRGHWWVEFMQSQLPELPFTVVSRPSEPRIHKASNSSYFKLAGWDSETVPQTPQKS